MDTLKDELGDRVFRALEDENGKCWNAEILIHARAREPRLRKVWNKEQVRRRMYYKWMIEQDEFLYGKSDIILDGPRREWR